MFPASGAGQTMVMRVTLRPLGGVYIVLFTEEWHGYFGA